MGLFSAALTDQINQIAAKSNEQAEQAVAVNTRSMNDELNQMSKKVIDYFKDSPAILITTKEELHNYVDQCIEKGYAGIDTETTGLDRIHDHVVGASLYTPGQPECYIPIKHVVPIFDTLYKNQLTYEEVQEEFQRLVDGNVKLIFANADFDLAMIYKDIKVDMIPAFYYDVITAWRCLREDEKDNSLKGLYAKYVKKGNIDPQKFSDFFSPKLFPNCKPQVAALYAANDAKITYELFIWQLPYVTKSNEKCKKHHLEKIADLIWNIEFPLVAVCAHLHRRGLFLDDSISVSLHDRYTSFLHKDERELASCVQELIDTKDIATNRNRPFRSGSDFNPNSNPHVKYLINNLLGSTAKTTSKEVLKEINKPATKAVLKVRGDVKLLSTYVDKLPRSTGPDHRIHSTFKAIGAATGRMASEAPNTQNIPSHATDIRHMFRATPEQDEVIDLTKYIDSSTPEKVATVKLSKYSKVRTGDDLTALKDLTEGQRFWFNLESGSLPSTEVRNINIDKGDAIISFDTASFEGNSTKLEIKNPAFVVMSSDFSQQEPRLTATVSGSKPLIDAFINGRDVYATISSIALGFPYEECLEFNPITGELQPEGKERRSIGKVLNLGITYGMSVQSISESLFGTREDMTDEQKLKEAQKIQDSLMKGFPDLARAISDAQRKAATLGYTETILGRRRHHPNMQLPKFEFEPMDGYVNPDIDPLDPKSLENKEQIPKRIIDNLTKEFNSYKWYGKIVKRTKELAEQKIKVINNSYKIEEASRQVFNAIIQGSAADLTKMAMLRLEHDPEWEEVGGRFLLPVHDELICEVPLENAEKGAEVLARCMCEAGDFLPFKLSCDVETTFRWYGLPVKTILEKEKPASLDWDNLSESNIEWLQCMITENEYILPTFPEEDGSKPSGVKARGINGKVTDELKESVDLYMKRYNLSDDQSFLDHIEAKVIRGVY